MSGTRHPFMSVVSACASGHLYPGEGAAALAASDAIRRSPAPPLPGRRPSVRVPSLPVGGRGMDRRSWHREPPVLSFVVTQQK